VWHLEGKAPGICTQGQQSAGPAARRARREL